jgi:hypothetical protein
MTRLYPREKLAKSELVINGIVYDVTEFVDKHPGGSIILESLNPADAGFPADATAAFEALHGHSKAPWEWLTRLKKQGKTRKMTAKEIERFHQSRPHDEQLERSFKRITKELKDKGMFDYTLSHFLYRNLELAFFAFWGAYCILNPGMYLGYWHGVLCLGIFMMRSGWYQHEANHGSISPYQTLNNIVGSFWFGFGEGKVL